MSRVELGQLKQQFMVINNQVNHEIFGRGLRKQKVYIIENKIFIIAENQRVPALATLDRQGVPTREIDLVLLDTYKARLKELVENKLGLRVKTVLKDYDPVNEISGNILIIEES